MSLFIVLMASGLAGMFFMALPGLTRGHGHASHHNHHGFRGARAQGGRAHFLPEPRTLLSVMAFYGAAGNVAEKWFHLPFWISALAAVVPALVLERVAARPLWSLALKFQGLPSSPLSHLAMENARALTVFRNGKGLVEAIKDGRTIQLSARLSPEQLALPVRVGDKLRIEDVDPESERVTVSVQ